MNIYDATALEQGSEAKTILELNANEALDFLLKNSQYHNFELPEYFDFDHILDFVRKRVGGQTYEDCISGVDVQGLTDANFEILLNKDGKYGVRPLTLVNPYLYYFLSREMCDDSNWADLRGCFKSFAVPHITSCAMPVIPQEKEPFHKSTTILNWWNKLEQRSLELSLQFRYMFITDITNCYGSIQPESIKWAMEMRDTSKAAKNHSALAGEIIKYVKLMQQGRNVGIPQGSCLFDLIGEIVLGYSDLLLHEAIQKEMDGFEGYEILRYRDDYRVFCNDRDKLEQLTYILQRTMERLNFRMNTQKTSISESIVTDSIKPDKLFFVSTAPNFKGFGIEKRLLYILMFGRKYPNAGQLKTMLSDLDQRLENILKPRQSKDIAIPRMATRPKKLDGIKWTTIVPIVSFGGDTTPKKQPKLTDDPHIKENKRAIIAIATQIAVENVAVVNYALRVVSRILKDIEDEQERKDIVKLLYARLRNQPNSSYTQVWLQNITYNSDVANHESPYDLPLCRLVMGERVKIWDNSWLKPSITKSFPTKSIVSKNTLSKNDSIITFRESREYSVPFEVECSVPIKVL